MQLNLAFERSIFINKVVIVNNPATSDANHMMNKLKSCYTIYPINAVSPISEWML
ncbi:MAG: hypothetical protein NC902_06565 [Candidatus Omnitrophica bacterium]|nr:hypothetical protein [Candidatus Omnitrophota bacterium]